MIKKINIALVLLLAIGFVLTAIFSYYLGRNSNKISDNSININEEKLTQNTLPKIISKPEQLMAWIYPGEPSCDAPAEFSKQKIHILKPEYFAIIDGNLILLTEDEHGCNGFSKKNVEELKKYSEEQFVTVAGADVENIASFLDLEIANGKSIDELVDFVVENNLTGIEIDFEDFSAWDEDLYQKYQDFLQILGDRLHQNSKKLMIDGPAISNDIEQGYFIWRYADFKNLPIDSIVVMAYDYQYDHGPGSPIAPLHWLREIVKWVSSDLGGTEKLTIGLPSYGYKAEIGTQNFELLNYEQISREPGFESARRDESSGEMTWSHDGFIYFYNDSKSLDQKKSVLNQQDINSISVWHLGGNQWFSE